MSGCLGGGGRIGKRGGGDRGREHEISDKPSEWEQGEKK
ncbi:MAG: hypothetical protein UY18_C0045G0007 [Microgenomates group bacterium GW2011_GWF2_47_9]|nr:MAG: hypothetical protein UY18_C0045G0007 [Microgenomates group bacterium GW2011_GWF2_47_9]